MTKVKKGSFGYLNGYKKQEWIKAILMLSVPIVIFFIGWIINKSRMTVVTVFAIVGCLPGCNQVVHAMIASRYHSIEKNIYEETESVRGERLALYENVFTTYKENYYVDVIVISGRDVVGYTCDAKMDTAKAAEHLKTILKNNAYKQNVKIFTEKKAFLERVRTLAAGEEEAVPFNGDERYPDFTRAQIIRYLLMAISL